MYNGIGLSTPRGSGTNGYVVRNLSAVRRHPVGPYDRTASQEIERQKVRSADQSILAHEAKRKCEAECLELQEKLEDEGLPQEEIEERVGQLRRALTERRNRDFDLTPADVKSLKPHQIHNLVEAKEKEMRQIRRALRIRDDYVEGSAIQRSREN